ncbi:MAG: O-antigen ligase family protein [Clostridia bacterium]|nr:O-antigen ligase family protein [Clostridia bacterium]MDE7329227.1 O-antigen ligase family protein [Clostridia bacterium]
MTETKFLTYVKKGYNYTESIIKKFVFTDFYLILVCAAVFIGWATKCAPFGLGSIILVSCIALLFADDILPLTVNLFSGVLAIYSYDFSDYVYLWPLAIPLFICLIFFMVKNRKSEFRLGKMFFPLMAVAIALLVGGIGYGDGDTHWNNFLRALPDFCMLGLAVPLIYLLYSNYLKRDDERDIPLYFSKTLMYLGLVISLQLISVISTSNIPVSEWQHTVWDIGWANRNGIATYLTFTAGMTVYLSTRYRQGWIYLLFALMQYVCLILTFSRGGIIFGTLSGIIAIIIAIIKAPNKKIFAIYLAAILLAALIVYLAARENVNEVIQALLERGTGTSGRFELYKEAWGLFKDHPFLGVGRGYVGTGTIPNEIGIYWFHSTIFQILAGMGLVGLVAYVYYYVIRFKILFMNFKNSFNLFVLAVWIGFEGYCLINTGTFIGYPYMALVIVMTLLLERTQKDFNNYVTPYNCSTAIGAKIAKAGGFRQYINIKKGKNN